jgi:hypothetical protein
MAVYLNMDLFISYHMLVLILGSFNLLDQLLKWVLGYSFGGCIGGVAVDYQVNGLQMWVRG